MYNFLYYIMILNHLLQKKEGIYSLFIKLALFYQFLLNNCHIKYFVRSSINSDCSANTQGFN